jgi:hypothetical protein
LHLSVNCYDQPFQLSRLAVTRIVDPHIYQSK